MSALVKQFERDECCTRICLEAQTRRRHCRCACGGRWHGTRDLKLIDQLPQDKSAGGMS